MKKIFFSTVVKINFHGSKNEFYSPCHPQTSVSATCAQVTLSFDWLAFAVKLVTLSFDLAGIRGKTCSTLI